MPERERLKGRDLQKAIIELARRLGWRVGHTPPVKTERGWRTPVAADGKGFPDLVLVRERVVWAEVKGDTDRLKREQQDWHTALRLAGQEVYVWTPEEWVNGDIEATLRLRVAPHRYEPRLHSAGCNVGGCDLPPEEHPLPRIIAGELDENDRIIHPSRFA